MAPTGKSSKPVAAPTVKVTFRLPDELIQRAKHYAIDERLTLQDVTRRALEKFLGPSQRGR
jgi:hypothetical protein